LTVFDWNCCYFIGQLDPAVYINVLQEENTRLKKQVQSLVDELTTLENQRGGKFCL
jgi:hypothetical protein